jgi:hypothetical protein
MPWAQDVVISVLFPYLLPSFSVKKKEYWLKDVVSVLLRYFLPAYKNECWSKEDIRYVFEELLMFLCKISLERTQEVLETFVRRMLFISSSCKTNLDDDLLQHNADVHAKDE